MESYKKILVSALLFFVATPAISQKLSHMQYPCDDAPDDAVLTVPESVSHLVQVQCTVYGHVITGTPEYFWSYPYTDGDGTYSGYFSAQTLKRGEAGQNFLTERYNKDYFVRIESSHLDQEQAQITAKLLDSKSAQFDMNRIGIFAGNVSYVNSVDVLHLVTNSYDEARGRFFESSFEVYFFEYLNPEEWGSESLRAAYIDSPRYHNWGGESFLWLRHLYDVDEVEAVELARPDQ